MIYRNVGRLVATSALGLWALGCGESTTRAANDGGVQTGGASSGNGGSSTGSGGSSKGGNGAGSGGTSTGSGGTSTGTGGAGKGGNNVGKGGTASTGGSTNVGGFPPFEGDAAVLNCPVDPSSARPTGTPPALTVGVWKNITPSAANIGGTFGANSIDFDPQNPWTLYASFDERGLWKSTDGGSTWRHLQNGPAAEGSQTGTLDSPLRVAVDPCDGNHLYATQGVRGTTLGFWVSRDGGERWVQPPAFVEVAQRTTNDVTTLAVDPSNFAHVLVGSHSPWDGGDAGIIETHSGGGEWRLHRPNGGFQVGSIGIGFVYDPKHNIGNKDTWVLKGDGMGIWRTTNAGNSWERVSGEKGAHGGDELFVAPNGHIYFPGEGHPSKSTDLGKTWTSLDNGGLPYGFYLSMTGDDKGLYTGLSCACGDSPFSDPFYVSRDNGASWTVQRTATPAGNGPYRMRFDTHNRIIYAANWAAGVWALKVD